MEWNGVRNATFVKSMSKTPGTQTESSYTSAFSDISANLLGRSKIVLRAPMVSAKNR